MHACTTAYTCTKKQCRITSEQIFLTKIQHQDDGYNEENTLGKLSFLHIVVVEVVLRISSLL